MTVTYHPVGPDDVPDVAAFLAAHDWPFHTGGSTFEQSAERYVGDECRSHWICDAGTRIGLVRVFDLYDGPMFDLRIAADRRGRGIGSAVVRWLTDDVFARTDAKRLEATTRVDNVAMRRALAAAGYAKECHYRRAWPVGGGQPMDSVGYAVLRTDLATGRVTPVDFDDGDGSGVRP